MAQWTPGWSVSTVYASLLTLIRDMLLDLAKGNDPAKVTVSNPVTDMIRWSSGSSRWEIYNGSTWGLLATTYAINISGSAASAAAVPWSGVSSKPTTIAGFGITDAITTGTIGSQSVNYANSAGTAANANALGGVAATNYARTDAIPTFSGGSGSGDHGGKVRLQKPLGGGLAYPLMIDAYGSTVRFYEDGSTFRGWHLHLDAAAAGAGAAIITSQNISLQSVDNAAKLGGVAPSGYAPATAIVGAARVDNVSGNNVIRFTRANGATFDVIIGAYTGGGD